MFAPGFHGLGLAREGDAAEEESRKLSACSLPPSFQAGRNFIQERKKKGGDNQNKQRTRVLDNKRKIRIIRTVNFDRVLTDCIGHGLNTFDVFTC